MSTYESLKYNFNGASLVGVDSVSTGTILAWADSSIPSGYLECDGSAVSRSTYAALFAVIGTTYGVGDGSTTFNVPNLQDNVAVGKSGTKTLASTGGANTVASSGNVSGSTANATLSTAQLASHSHSGGSNNAVSSTAQQVDRAIISASTGATGSSSGHAHNMSANFSGDANSVLQPYLTLIFVIKT